MKNVEVSVSTFRVSELVGRLAAAATALPHAGRLVECERLLREGPGTTEERIQRFTLALQDGVLIVEVAEAFLAWPAEGKRLVRALSGPTVVVPEGGPDKERDELWELWLAARFRREALSVQFGDDVAEPNSRRPDLLVPVDGIRLAVEAKRSRSLVPLEDRVRRAVGQIHAACEGGYADGGLIALDLSFATEQHAQVGRWVLESEDAKTDVRALLKMEVAKTQKRVHKVVAEQPGGPDVVGAVIQISPVLEDTHGQFREVRYCQTCTYSETHPAAAALRALAKACFADDDRGVL